MLRGSPSGTSLHCACTTVHLTTSTALFLFQLDSQKRHVVREIWVQKEEECFQAGEDCLNWEEGSSYKEM